jgi:hypothetical protein
MSPRARSRILANLEAVYRDAYNRAKEAGDKTRMLDLDAAYQREQLLLEVLLDIRDGLHERPADQAGGGGGGGGVGGVRDAVQKLQTLQKLTKLKG